MSQKRKSPPAATEGQAKLAKFACNYVATSARPAQAESCDRCQFFRRVALASGRDRLLCMLSGEKLRTAAGGCDLFAPGKWEEVWGDPAPAPRQSWLCRVCTHGIVPSFRAPPSSALWDAAPIICRTGAAGLSSAPASR